MEDTKIIGKSTFLRMAVGPRRIRHKLISSHIEFLDIDQKIRTKINFPIISEQKKGFGDWELKREVYDTYVTMFEFPKLKIMIFRRAIVFVDKFIYDLSELMPEDIIEYHGINNAFIISKNKIALNIQLEAYGENMYIILNITDYTVQYLRAKDKKRVKLFYCDGKFAFIHQEGSNNIGYMDLQNMDIVEFGIGRPHGYLNYSVNRISSNLFHIPGGTHEKILRFENNKIYSYDTVVKYELDLHFSQYNEDNKMNSLCSLEKSNEDILGEFYSIRNNELHYIKIKYSTEVVKKREWEVFGDEKTEEKRAKAEIIEIPIMGSISRHNTKISSEMTPQKFTAITNGTYSQSEFIIYNKKDDTVAFCITAIQNLHKGKRIYPNNKIIKTVFVIKHEELQKGIGNSIDWEPNFIAKIPLTTTVKDVQFVVKSTKKKAIQIDNIIQGNIQNYIPVVISRIIRKFLM